MHKKEFDLWNESKKNINQFKERRYYRPKEVWWCALGINIGFEEDGTGDSYERPVLILRGFSKYVCLVVPLTTSTKKNPYHVNLGIIDGKDSFAIISQLRLVDTKRLLNRVDIVGEEVFKVVKEAVRGSL